MNFKFYFPFSTNTVITKTDNYYVIILLFSVKCLLRHNIMFLYVNYLFYTHSYTKF